MIGLAGSQPRCDCLREIEEVLITLIPDSQGGAPRNLASRFRKSGSFFRDENLHEDFLDRVETCCCTKDLDADSLGSELARIIPGEADDLLKSTLTALQTRQSLHAWIRMGSCLEKGLCPTENPSAFIKIRLADEQGPELSIWKTVKLPGTPILEHEVLFRRFDPGELPINELWIKEIDACLRQIDSRLETVAINGVGELFGSSRIAALEDFANQVIEGFRKQQKVIAKAVTDPKQTRDAEESCLNDPSIEPPAEYQFGPLTGNKTEMGYAIRSPQKRDPNHDLSFRNDLKRAVAAKKPRIWIRWNTTKDALEVYFRDQKAFDDAKSKLPSFPERRSKGERQTKAVGDAPQ